MRQLKFIVPLLIFVLASAIYFSQKSAANCVPNRGWCAATYYGLTVGQSTRADMLRVLGEPLSSVPSADQDEPRNIIWHDYKSVEDDIPGRLGVEVDKRTDKIVGITIAPDEMSKEEMIKRFGADYIVMGYEFCAESEEESLLTAGTGFVYESPSASELSYIEYRAKGMSINIQYKDKVSEVYFTNEPMGLASKDDCQRELNKLKANSQSNHNRR